MSLWFFTSYARKDDEFWGTRPVQRFFEHLRDEVVSRCGDQNAKAFLDQRDLVLGDKWQYGIETALRVCKTFVPLLSPAYFLSENCGKEWTVFERRCSEYTRKNGRRPSVLVPVLWVPPVNGEFPEFVRDLEISFSTAHVPESQKSFVEDYWKHGLLWVQKRSDSTHGQAYYTVVEKTAQRLIRAAKANTLDSLPESALPALAQVEAKFPEGKDSAISYSTASRQFSEDGGDESFRDQERLERVLRSGLGPVDFNELAEWYCGPGKTTNARVRLQQAVHELVQQIRADDSPAYLRRLIWLCEDLRVSKSYRLLSKLAMAGALKNNSAKIDVHEELLRVLSTLCESPDETTLETFRRDIRIERYAAICFGALMRLDVEIFEEFFPKVVHAARRYPEYVDLRVVLQDAIQCLGPLKIWSFLRDTRVSDEDRIFVWEAYKSLCPLRESLKSLDSRDPDVIRIVPGPGDGMELASVYDDRTKRDPNLDQSDHLALRLLTTIYKEESALFRKLA